MRGFVAALLFAASVFFGVGDQPAFAQYIPAVIGGGLVRNSPALGNPGSYTCLNGTFDTYGRETAATTGSCNAAQQPYPFNTCTNTNGIITCTAPCIGWPIVMCTTPPTSGAAAVPLLLAAKPAIGDVLLAITNQYNAATFAPGWTPVSVCNPGGIIPNEAYHVVGPADGQIYSPSTLNGGNSMIEAIVDVTALGAKPGSWTAAFNTSACATNIHPPVTVSGTVPGAGAIEVALGVNNASSGSYSGMSLVGIATDANYGSTLNSTVPAAMGVGFGIGGGAGSAYSSTWSNTGGAISDNTYAAVLFFNPGNTLATPSCTVSSGTCAMTSQSGPAAMIMTLSGAAAATTLTLANFPDVANDYVCAPLMDKTTGTIWGLQSAWSTTGGGFTFYTKGTATAASPGAADILMTTCWGA